MGSADTPPSSVSVRPAREQLVAETFVLLADTLVDDFDVVEMLDRLAAACVDLLDVTAAGLVLDHRKGVLAVVASSSEPAWELLAFQLLHDQGPCVDSFRSGSAVTTDSLDTDLRRWPLFAPAALAAGFRCVTAFPLRLRNRTIGSLTTFSSDVGPVPLPRQRLGQLLADVATIGILQQRSLHRNTLLSQSLQYALESRSVIEQAKGVLAEHNHVDMDTAYDALRRHARHHDLMVTDVAVAVVGGGIDLASLPVGPAVR